MPHYFTSMQREKAIHAKLQYILNQPERKAAELEFAADHANDTDIVLYTYLKERKRMLKKRMSPANTVGYLYCVQRLGPWCKVMCQINTDLSQKSNVP